MQMYKISFPNNLSSKEYIGISSKGAKRRFAEHCCSKKNYPIVLAIKKYGRENAILEVLGEFDNYDDMYKAEQEAIIKHGTKHPNGYNLTDGGKGAYGCKATEERKRKISEANKGRKLSIEASRKISEASKGRDFSIQIEAMRKAATGRKRSKEERAATAAFWTGRKHREGSKLKMSVSASRRRASDDTKKKMSEAIRAAKGDVEYSFAGPDGESVKTRDLKHFCKENNLSRSHMYNVHNGKAKAHKGWSLSTS